MKTIKLFLAILLVTSFGAYSSAQTTSNASEKLKSETFKVAGNCDMCKTRIEKAVKEEGVSSADWSTKTKILTVTFDPSKTNIDALEKKIASVGHDTDKFKASDEAYAKLPGCCKYERMK